MLTRVMMPHAGGILVEAAVDALDDAIAAEAEGVDRIELCGPLDDGGTTPEADLVERCLARVKTPIHVLVRPRAGDFVYDAIEIDRMRGAIARVRTAGAAGVVTGVLGSSRTVDVAALKGLIEAARPMQVGFHRAFDHIGDQLAALETLASLGVDLVLTSGGAPTAVEGAARLRALVERAGDRIGIIAAGSITSANVAEIVRRTGVRQVHGRAFRGLRAAAKGAGPR